MYGACYAIKIEEENYTCDLFLSNILKASLVSPCLHAHLINMAKKSCKVRHTVIIWALKFRSRTTWYLHNLLEAQAPTLSHHSRPKVRGGLLTVVERHFRKLPPSMVYFTEPSAKCCLGNSRCTVSFVKRGSGCRFRGGEELRAIKALLGGLMHI